jgi:hypothetical protein
MTEHEMEATPGPGVPALREPDMQRLAQELVASAQQRGLELTEEDGRLIP